MKKRVLSIFMTAVMCLSLLPTAAFAEESSPEYNNEPPAVSEQGDIQENPAGDSAVTAAQALIDALPTIDTVTAADYDAVQDAYDVYLELTEEQQAKISGAAVFEELFGWFNEQTATVAENIAKIDKKNTPTAYCTTWYEIQNYLNGYEGSNQITITLLADTIINQEINISNNVKIDPDGHTVNCENGGKLSVVGSGAVLTIFGNSSKTFNVPIEISNGSTVTLEAIQTNQEIKFNSTDGEIGSGTELVLKSCTLKNTATFTVVGDAKVLIGNNCTFAGGISMSKNGRTLAEVVGDGVALQYGAGAWVSLTESSCTGSVTSVIAPLKKLDISVMQNEGFVSDRDGKYPLNYGEKVTFEATVTKDDNTASDTTTYQWYFDGTAISGAATATCDYYDGTTNKLPLGEHTIRCEATNNGFTRPYSVTVVVTCDHKNGDVSAIDTTTGVCEKCEKAVSHDADYSWYTNPSTNEFTISTAGQLTAFANIVNGTNLPSGITQSSFSGKTVKLDANINLEMKVTDSVTFIPNWTPIGTYEKPFAGEFDGQDKKITNLKSKTSDAGLFGRVVNPAVIKDLTVEGTVEGSNVAGGIVAQVDGGNTKNVEILNCTFKGTVKGGAKTGGIVGSTQYCTIKQCANYAAVSATGGDAAVGGIVGAASYKLTIENCFNQGEIKGEESDSERKIGGLVGNIKQTGEKQIKNCYSIGAVSGNGTKGALVGVIDESAQDVTTMSNCYYLSGEFGAIGTGGNPSNCNCTGKIDKEFYNGDVAWLLQSKAAVNNLWGQKLSGSKKDTYPVFSNDTVYRVSFKDKGDTTELCDAKYVNSGEVGFLPTPSSATGFCGWNTAANNGGDRFTTTTQITADTTLYACVKNATTYEVTMNGYFVGETPSTPSISPVVDDVTYYYSTSNKIDSTWTEWNTSNPPTLAAGTYYMRAEVGETATSASATTNAKQFSVSEPVASVTVDGTTTNYAHFYQAENAVNKATGTNVTLMLEKNCSPSTVTITRSMTLDLNGKKLSATSFCIKGNGVVVTIQNGETTNLDANLYVYDGAKVKIAGGTFKKLYVGQNPSNAVSTGSAELSGGTFTGVSNSNGSVLNLLAEGYSYQRTGGTWHQSDSAISESVTVKPTPFKSVSVSPATMTLTYGYTTAETLTAATDAVGGSYQWYKVENETKTPIDGATESTYAVPTGLSVGTHQFTCAVTKDGFVQWGDVASVTVNRKKSSGGGETNVSVEIKSDKGSMQLQSEVTKDTVAVSAGSRIDKIVSDGAGTVTVDAAAIADIKNVQISADIVERINTDENANLVVALPDGSVTLEKTALESIDAKKDVTVSVEIVPATDLTEEQQNTVGDMANIGLVVDVDIFVGNTKQSDFGGKLTVSIPYTPKKGEDTSKLTVWFIRDDGTIEDKGGYYDAKKKCFVFETDHLSRYVLMRTDAEVTEVVVEDAGFIDVPAEAYYAEAVNWAAANGITGGVDATHFAPDAPCTRGQIVSFLWRAAGKPEPTATETPFADVSKDAYYHQAVLWAASLGIVNGYGNGLFGTDDNVTREQLVAILYRFAVQMDMDVSVGADTNILSYQDAFSVSEYAMEAFQWACGAGVVYGEGGNLMPDSHCTRAQIVTMLYRLLSE